MSRCMLIGANASQRGCFVPHAESGCNSFSDEAPHDAHSTSLHIRLSTTTNEEILH